MEITLIEGRATTGVLTTPAVWQGVSAIILERLNFAVRHVGRNLRRLLRAKQAKDTR